MILKDKEYVLSTGKTLSTNMNIIGLNPKEDRFSGFELYDGFDTIIWDNEYTNEELGEIADYMISLWTDYKENIFSRSEENLDIDE